MQALCLVILLLARGLSSKELPETPLSKGSLGLPASMSLNRLEKKSSQLISLDIFGDLAFAIGGGYFTEIMIGTPPQPQQVQIGTGAGWADTYVLSTSFCQSPDLGGNPCLGGHFNTTNSSTYSTAETYPAFNATYATDWSFFGPFGRDAITIGDVGVENVQFGVVQTGNVTGVAQNTTGVLGLGYSADEITNGRYPNIPEILQDAGLINSRLYSIYLDGFGASGNVLFGGIDSSKYSGELVTLDLLPAAGDDEIMYFNTNVSALSVTTGSNGVQQTIFSADVAGGGSVGNNNGSAVPAILTVGYPAWQIPTDYYDQLINSSFAFVNEDSSCSCDYRYDDIVLQVEFGATTVISVPAMDLIVPLYNSTNGSPLTFPNGTDMCSFLVEPASPYYPGYTIGEAILRSMYVVFDLDNAQVSIAQANINSTTPNDIRAVAAGPSGVQQAASRVQTAPMNTNSIATTVSDNAAFSTFAVSTAMTSTATTLTHDAATASRTSSVTGTTTSPTPSKGASASLTLERRDDNAVWSLTLMLLIAAFAGSLTT